MNTLLIILLCIFGGVALMVTLTERFAKPADEEQVARLSRWIMPLVALAIVLSMIKFLF